jgi:transposase
VLAETRTRIAELRGDGLSCRQIAEVVDRPYSTVARLLRESRVA